MDKPKPINRLYNYSLSQLFSPSLVKKISDPSHENSIKDLLSKSNLYPSNEKWDLSRGLKMAYEYLKENYRCEYVYKNEIANQILIKLHGDNSATLLKEVNSNSSIADVVIINGETTAYEIKTELDSFERLPSQIDSYQSLYDYVYIVTHTSALPGLYSRIDNKTGIIVLEKNGLLKKIKSAKNNKMEFSPERAVLTLRQSELVTAYQKAVGKLPRMGTALIFDFCYKWFISLDKKRAHAIFAQSLKSRKPSAQQFELIKKCDPSLKMLFLGKELPKKYCLSTINKLGIFV